MSCPDSLLEIQRWIGRIITRPLREMGGDGIPIYDQALEQEVQTIISPGPHLTAQQRIGLYNQQYWFRLFTILQEQYPTLTRLFGFGSFNRDIGEPYLLKLPPNHWALSRLGYRLTKWLEKEYQEEDKTLVYETALVDAAFESLFFAKAQKPLELTDFTKIKTERLYLQPTVQILSLHADLFSFRKKMLEHEPEYWILADFPSIEWGDERHFALSKESGPEEISINEMLLLKAFRKGSPLRAACKGISLDAEPFIAGWFKHWTQRGWLTMKND